MEITIDREGDAVWARLAGRFDVNSIFAFRNAVKSLVGDAGVRTLKVDFGRVSFVDSSALGVLLLLREEAVAVDKAIVLAHCGPPIRKILTVAQFPRLFHIE